MKATKGRRLLSALLSLLMLVSLLPISVLADDATVTATQITQASELVDGQYVLVTDSGYAPGVLDGTWLTAAAVTADENAVTVDPALLWTVTVGTDGIKLKDSSGNTIAPKGGNNNGIQSGDYSWKVSFADGKFSFAGQGDDTVTLASNKGSQNKFRAYKNATVEKTPGGYPSEFTLYKLDTAAVRESGIVTDLSTLKDGDTVVVFNPVNLKTLSTEYSGFYNKGNDVKVENGKLTGFTDVDKWTLGINDDGTYSFSTAKGEKLSMDTGYTSTPLDKVNNSWKLTAVDGKDGTFYIDNTGRTDKYRLQWYASKGTWSAYTGTGDAFEQQIYLVIETETPDPTPTPEPSALLKDGDKVVIYNPANLKALSTDYGGYYNKGTDVKLTDGKLTGYTKADIWTVGVNADGNYTFSTADGKKLSMGASYTSTPLDDVNTAWQLEEAKTAGCYYIKNAVRGNYLEWYADKGNWSSFSKISDEALFAQAFFKVKESGIVTSLSAGDTVVIFNPANLKALSTDYGGYYNKGTDVKLTDGKLTGYTKADIWTVGVNADGSYTFSTADGKKLSMGASYTSTPLDDVNTAWQLEEAKTAGCYYIKNAVRGNYLEWYADKGNWSSFSKISDEALFAQQFYLVVDDGGSDTPAGGLPETGSEVVIYNANAAAVLAAQDSNTESPSILKAAATIQDGKASCANGAVVFTVEKNGDYYRFYNKTYGYLCANGTGNNAFYTQTASEDADWLIRTCSGGVGGFEMESRTAKFNDKYSQWLEYYNDSFKVYSMYNVTDYTIYSFNFYPAVGSTIVDGIVNTPAFDFGTVLPAYVGQDYELTFTVDAPFGVSGDIKAWLSDDTALSVAKNEDGTYTISIPDALISGDKLTVSVKGTDNKNIPIYSTVEIEVKDNPSVIDPMPEARSETGSEKRPTIGATIVNAGIDPTIEMTVNGTAVKATVANGKISYTPDKDMADGRVDVQVTVKRTDGKSAALNWYFIVGKAQYQRYFGQLHSHTQYSDGSGSLDTALDYVKNLPESANVQFVAFTDHSNYFDTTSAANPEGALYDMDLATAYSQQRWKEYKDKIADFNSANTGVIAIGGFEMTWSGGPGHINTFNTEGIVSRNNKTLNNKTSDAGMKAYYALLSQSEGIDSISQFNHPGTTFGTFSDFAYWDGVIDSRIYMVEVGNGEGQIGAGGYYPSYEYYIMALDKGWHVAPTNNQDNHKGKWGNANDARDVIITDNFSEEGIYEAIRERRMYSTEDKNLELGYTVNGSMMGSTLSTVPEALDIEVSVADPDKTDSISKVEIVANSGKVVYTWDDPAELTAGLLTAQLAPSYSYYFVRVTEADGDLAVTAPVWVGEMLKLGVSSFVCGTSTPVTGEELTLTTTMFNSETTDATVKALSYTIGGVSIGVDQKGYTVAAGSTLEIPFKWTPDKAHVTTVTVTAVVEQGGNEYTFTKTLELDVQDADKLVYIGIDASHYNEYVAGNYKDSMGNFGNLAAQYSVRTVTLGTSADLIAACGNSKYKAIILTAPSRRLEAAQADPRVYSDAELAAIKAFNASGGTVILAGWSDNYENYDVIQNNPAIKHMAETQNEVLAALGSSLRISDDATYDDVRSAADGVDKWRLYFSDYNYDNPLTGGVIYDADHPYDKLYTERFSHYGGASIYAVDASGNAASTLPSTVSPVVYGHATTYSIDVDGDGLGGAGTPKYAFKDNDSRLMVMATEQLDGKGLIVVSGAAFMSNFEVQAQVDNGAEKNYSNYRICQNLLGMLNPVTITPIADVQAEKDENVKYTIEGIVTSNASGYDKDTAFFDCIYVQDGTAGINCFPVAGNFKIGDKVRISGTTSSYQGERQLAVSSIEKIGEETPVQPTVVTSKQINDGSVLGSLVTVKGVITRVEMANGLVQTIMVKDANGDESRVFIDGYITTAKDVVNAEVGREITATGLASYDNTFTLSDGTAVAPRIRIRDRADVVCGDKVEHTHAFGEWTVTKEATCTEDGEQTRTCDCGCSETQVIPATGHDYVNGVCANCGAVQTPDKPTPDTPDKPTPDTPDKPTPDTPDKPTPDTPDKPTPDTPDKPTPDTPDKPTPDTPDKPTPDTPDKPTPDTPDKPTPDTPDKADDGDAVKTGDDSAVGLWIALICLSLIGPAVIVYSKKREH
ncbi:MAG: CehA/McbA family metallohydrolase [Oscillospiraceae bacterium]|nr:CehA/McbA family metallohydrolase [Oscillospiraceae bacterium]